MKYDIDLKMISQVVITLVIAAIVGFMFINMVAIGDRNREGQSAKIKEVIDKALVQCYALEGSFPADVHYLQKYGVLFEDDKYLYEYEIFGTNYIPNLTVISKTLDAKSEEVFLDSETIN